MYTSSALFPVERVSGFSARGCVRRGGDGAGVRAAVRLQRSGPAGALHPAALPGLRHARQVGEREGERGWDVGVTG